MTSEGANSILLPKLLADVKPTPIMFCCCCMGGSISVLRPPSDGEGDGGTGGEETGEGLRGRYGERDVDSAFWDASSADTASELSWCTVAWASSVMSITPPLWRWDNDGVWHRDGTKTNIIRHHTLCCKDFEFMDNNHIYHSCHASVHCTFHSVLTALNNAALDNVRHQRRLLPWRLSDLCYRDQFLLLLCYHFARFLNHTFLAVLCCLKVHPWGQATNERR